MKPVLRFETEVIRAADLGKESSIPDLFGELILQNELRFCLDEEDEIYEGYGRRANAYPYRQYNQYTKELTEKEIKTAVLENTYLKAVFLPEYGGRLWELWDKETGRNLLYTNDVLQFRNLAVRNAWFSGGVEWNIGIIGHTPFTTDPMYTAETKNENGDPVLRMYEYERIRKVVYQMDFWLEEESRFLNCRMRIANENKEVVPMYWWSNIAVEEYEDGRIIVPAAQAFTNKDWKVYKADIPYVDGIDVTAYKNIPTSVDYFFDIPKKREKYIANVDKTGYGLLQLSTDRLRSRKLFSWGNRDASDYWQEFLTDKAGRYLEIQAGLGKTQYGCIPMAPHTVWEWMEQYGAVQIPTEVLHKEHTERADFLTEKIRRQHRWTELEQKLKDTKEMAKREADVRFFGSGYGAMASAMEDRRFTNHLSFCRKKESLHRWEQFFETGTLHEPDGMLPPDEYLITEENTDFLEKNLEKNNADNWYAHYHMGIGYYLKGKYEKAKQQFDTSLSLVQNPWACHGMSCTCLRLSEKEEAVIYIEKGMKALPEDTSYLKEGFKILNLCNEYEKIRQIYEVLSESKKDVSKLKFYYIRALHMLGENEKAFALLEENGGLVMEDLREGEDSIAQLWSDIYESLYGEKGEIPHRYNVKAY